MQFIKHSLEIAFIVLLIGFILYVVFRPMVKRDNFNARQWLHNNTFFLCAAWIVVCLWRELCNFTVIAYQTEVLQFALFALSILHLALTGYLYGKDKINAGDIEDRAEAMTRKLLLFTLCFLPTALLITFSILPLFTVLALINPSSVPGCILEHRSLPILFLLILLGMTSA